MNWIESKFKTLILDKSGYTWSKDQESKTFSEKAIRVLTVSNIQKNLDLKPQLYLQGVSEADYLKKRVSKDWTIAVSSNGNRNRIGNAVFIEQDRNFLFASFLTGFIPKSPEILDPRFFYYWLNSNLIQAKISSVSEGTTGLGNLDLRHLRNTYIRHPKCAKEQKVIAGILSKVDEAIQAVRDSIAAAEKLKKALMQNLLTGKLKPDGTWRGDDEFKTTKQNDAIPREWKEARFKTKISDKSGYTWSKYQESKIATLDSIRVLTVSNVQKNLDLKPQLYLSNVSDKDYVQKRVSKDWTIAVSSNGNRNRIGNAVFIEEDSEYLFASFLVGFRPRDPDEILPKYFYYWLNSEPIQAKISSISEGTTGLGNLDLRHLRNSKLYYPSNIEEQDVIVSLLTQQDSYISAKKSKIEKLAGLKKSLMQNLLTGKKRVDVEKINHLLNQS